MTDFSEENIARLIDALERNTAEAKQLREAMEGFKKNAGASVAAGILGSSKSASLVPARCTNCGAAVEVDPEEKAAICPYCGSAYIVDKAINNVTINVSGADAENLKERARAFAATKDWAKAIEYYERVLDCDAQDEEALAELDQVKSDKRFYAYVTESGVQFFDTLLLGARETGTLMLKEGRLVFQSDKTGKSLAYNLSTMKSVEDAITAMCITMNSGKQYKFKVSDIPYWVKLVSQACEGMYPPVC